MPVSKTPTAKKTATKKTAAKKAGVKKPGLYANIHAKQERIAHGSGETMRKPGEAGRPAAEDFDKAEKTEKTEKKPAAKRAEKKIS